jgi:hypothetical protein
MSLLRAMTFALSFATVIGTPRSATADPAVASANASEIRGRVGDPVGQEALAAPDREEVAVPEPRSTHAEAAASAAAFLPFTIGASTDATYGKFLSGYDGSRRAFVYEGAADARVGGGLSVRAGYSSTDLSGHASALLGARLQLLSQRRQGCDMGVGLFYLPQGIDGEGLVRGSLFVGREIDRVTLLGSVSYGQDPEGDDHHAELSVASLYRAAPELLLGADMRARGLVFSSDEKHDGVTEPVFDLALGPVAHYVLGPVVLTSEVGASALAMRAHGSVQPATEMKYGLLSLFSAGFAL